MKHLSTFFSSLKSKSHSRILLVVTSILLLAGCVFQTAYKQLDWATVMMLDRYVDLKSSQKDLTKANMQKLLAWHKQNEIPKLKALIQNVQAKPTNEITSSLLLAQWETLEASMWRTYDELEPYAYTFLRDLDKEQQAELLEYLNKKYQKRIDKYKKRSQEDRDERDLTNFSELVEYWVDDLTKEQEAILKQWGETKQHNYSLEVARYMLDEVGKFSSVVFNHELSEEDAKAKFAKVYADAKNIQPASLKNGLESNKQGKAEVLAQVLQTLTPKQEKYFRKRLAMWEDNFTIE